MRVVRIQSRICVGGPALHSILLSEGLSGRKGSKYETTLLGGALEPGEASMEALARSKGVEVVTVPEMGRSVKPGSDFVAIAKVARLLRKIRPQIVHTHTAKAGAVGRVAARLAGVPLVVHTFHGHVFDGYFSPAKTRFFIETERALARLSDHILSISEQQRVDLTERYRIAPARKVGVVPLGLELERFRAVAPRSPERGVLRRELGIPAEAPMVVTVGRLVPIKRFDLLIEAFRALQAELPEARLVIVGEGECREALEFQARGQQHVYFTGLRRDLRDIYADADLMALSSDNEGTPVAVIEAVASGVPVVATDVGGVRDILTSQGMGLVTRPGQVRGLADALRLRLTHRRAPSSAERDKIVRRYSHQRLIDDIEALYDRLLSERGGAAASSRFRTLREI